MLRVIVRACAIGLIAFALPPIASATISLVYRPAEQTVYVGDTVEIGLYAVSDDQTTQPLSAVDLVFAWDPAYLQLTGLNHDDAVENGGSFFPENDIFGLNEVVPPQDGDGLYVLFAPLFDAINATPQGVLLTTFEYLALDQTNQTTLDMLDVGGDPPRQTVVWGGGEHANEDVTGAIGTATVTIIPEPASILLFLTAAATLRRR